LEEASPKERRLILEADHLVILHPDGPAGGYPMAVRVDRVADGLHWFLRCREPIRRAATMIVESPIHDDARYVTQATVEASSPETFALKLKPIWERVQQRAFARIYAPGLQVRVLRPTLALAPQPSLPSEVDEDQVARPLPTTGRKPADSIHDLIDISAGGIRFQSDDDFEEDEQVKQHRVGIQKGPWG